jgi:hypothetical protein
MNKLITNIIITGLFTLSQAAVTTPEIEVRLDEVKSKMDSLGEYSNSTTLGKDDSPVSFSGEIITRLKNQHIDELSPLFLNDKAHTNMEATLRLSMGIFPSSYVNVWTIMDFPFDFSGIFRNNKAYDPNGGNTNPYERANSHHGFNYDGVSLWEEMTAGVDVRGGQFGGMLKVGGVLWVNASPFTIWDRDPMPRFTSSYETWEEEREVSRMYKEKTFRPVKEGGRAFWTNRSFGGAIIDMYRLPFDMRAQVMLAQPKDTEIGTRDGLKLLAGSPGDAEMNGSLDFRGKLWHGRLVKDKIWNDISVGANILTVDWEKEILYEGEFATNHAKLGRVDATTDVIPPYFIDNRVASIDMNGEIMKNLHLQLDVAASRDDTVKFRSNANRSQEFIATDYVVKESDPVDALSIYAKLQSKHWEKTSLAMIYVPKDFYSPYGFTDDSRNRTWRKDEIYLNAGSYRYQPNLIGLNLQVEPEFNRGRFDVTYGQHWQEQKGADVISFEHRLNGRSTWETMNSWSKFNSALALDSGSNSKSTTYEGRVGLEAAGSPLKQELQYGGLRGGTWETHETFVAWESAADIAAGNVPEHRKFSSHLSVDMAYDIGHWVNYDKNIQMAAYMTLSAITTSFTPLALTHESDDMLLWSYFVQSEPAIAITPSFHILGIFGYETWKAEKAYRKGVITRAWTNPVGELQTNLNGYTYYTKVPIDYYQTALGFGFDWDYAARAGLHVRYKRATHTDKNHSANDWKGHFVTAESKVWF